MNKPLIIFELANNHGGSVGHGLSIIESFSQFIPKYKNYYDFAIKFQFRNLDTFIHKDYKNRTDIKYVKRFLNTNISEDGFWILKNKAESLGFTTICTAFDEPSVELIVKMEFDIIKIASCSFTDWPLLNKIADYTNIPIIASTAGCTVDDMDKVVSFFTHRNRKLTLMHCVGEYPTDSDNLQLNQIDFIKQRYQNIKVGFSTHENPSETESIKIAIAKGAEVLEKHVGLYSHSYPLNAYSVTPIQMDDWLHAGVNALKMCGIIHQRKSFSDKEKKDLLQFKRGVFVKNDVKKGDVLDRTHVYYAWPSVENQVLANDMSKYIKYLAKIDISADKPLLLTDVDPIDTREKVWDIVQKVKKFIIESEIIFPGKAQLEISHHYGIDSFSTFGITMLTVINRDYCKKLIVVLPYQKHPEQYHIEKEETFMVLHGTLNLYIDGEREILSKGDVVTIEKNQRHKFDAGESGCIIEELSTTHHKEDSFYTDDTINNNKNRKTIVNYWL